MQYLEYVFDRCFPQLMQNDTTFFRATGSVYGISTLAEASDGRL